MRHITKNNIHTLKRRLAFLERRAKKYNGEFRGDSYDKAEIEALKTAIWTLEFIEDHYDIQRSIRTAVAYDELFNEEKEYEDEL